MAFRQVRHHARGQLDAARSASRTITNLPQILSSKDPSGQAMDAANRLGQDLNKYGHYFTKRFPEGAMRVAGNVGSTIVGARAQASVETANNIFKALGVQIWIIQPDTPHARVRVNVDESRNLLEADPSACDGAMSPREFVGFMREARVSGTIGGYDLETYMEGLISEAGLQSVPMLPASFQSKLYMDLAQLILFTFQRSVLTLDKAEVWGHTLKVNLSPAARFVGRQGHRRHKQSIVGKEQLKAIVDHMLASKAVHMPMIPNAMERRLYTNCMTVVFMLLEDLLTGESEGITFMGHRMRFHLSPMPVDFVRRVLEEHPVSHCHINEAALTELVDELLSHSDTNLAWMPDVIESRLYQSTMRLLIRIVEHIVSRMQLSVLGRHLDMSILSHLDMRRTKIEKDRRAAAGVTYYEEENPLLTVSTTELEERLKQLDERRRVLEALRDLGGASFDLTQETPILGEDSRKSAPQSSGTDRATTEATSDASDEKRQQVHEFQRLAPTLKLARTLHQSFEIDAGIEVPYTMIADLEGYASWMPWCTSGESPPDGKDFSTPKAFDGKVGFGFETGTFLGTVGDTVNYRLTLEPPKQKGHVQKGRVLADAENGFTYGKRLAYDWRFTSLGDNKTLVELDLLFQAHNVLYMPIWDAMQNMVVTGMLGAFQKRAAVLETQRATQKASKPAEAPPAQAAESPPAQAAEGTTSSG